MPQLKLYLFGSPRVTIDDQPIALPRRKVMAALIYISLSRKRLQRDTLATLLWPESERQSARSSLRRELHALNSAIGPDWLEATRNDIMLDPNADVWCDVDRFRDCLVAAKHPSAEENGNRPNRGQLLRGQLLKEAVELYQGGFLTGFTLSDCPAFDDWQFFESEELRRDYAEALEQLVVDEKAQQDYLGAISYAQRWLSLDSMEERIHRELMMLYALAGQHSTALRQYDECVRVLDEELGVPPEEETVALNQAIRNRQFPKPEAATDPTKQSRVATAIQSGPSPSGPSLSGEANTLPSSQASLPSSPRPVLHNFPSLSTSFIGRQDELEAIDKLLAEEPECRMLTLVGPGGIGKTRLAVAAAQRIVGDAPIEDSRVPTLGDKFRDGIYFVPLAALGEDDSILSAVADALSFSFQTSAEPLVQISTYLKGKSLLLILDNIEHLLDQAELLLELLNASPGLMLLITSREAVTLQEEWLYAVGGFQLPLTDVVPQDPASNSAIALFVVRARRADSSLVLSAESYATIARICHLVDGMPLGIELAATWVRVLSLDEIANEIESNLDFLATTKHSVLDRHSSMRTVLDQTWQLLSPTEQDAFCKLSIFQQGFTRQAASRIIDSSIMVLAALVRKSIVSHDRDGRYAIHGLLRQFAASKLSQESETAKTVAELHSRYYGTYLQAFEEDLSDTNHALALEKIGQELDNIRSGWRWAVGALDDTGGRSKSTSAQIANTYVSAFFQFYETRSRFQEGAAEFQLAVDKLNLQRQDAPSIDAPSIDRSESLQSVPPTERAFTEERYLLLGRVAARLGWLAFQAGQPDEAKGYLEESVSLLQSIDAEEGIVFALNYLGAVYRHLGIYDRAKEVLEESQQRCRATNDRFGLTVALNILGQIAYEQQRFTDAQTYLEESLTLKKSIGDRRGTTFSLLYLGMLAKERNDYAAAIRLFRESILISEEHGDRRGIAIGLSNLGDVEMAMDKRQKAQESYEASLDIYSDIYNPMGTVTTHVKLGDLMLTWPNVERATQHYEEALRNAADLHLPPESLDLLIGPAREWLAQTDAG